MTSVYVEKLRCTHCGAPLPQPKPGDPYVKCEYCGYVNRVSDSTNYVESLKREVAKWLSQLLPQQAIVSATADPVARYHVFHAYIKPRLIPVSVNARTRFVESVYRPLLVLNPVHRVECVDPKTFFEESLKVDSVSELAIAEEDRSFLGDIRRNLLVVAHVCNATVDALEEKFAEAAKNVEEALRLVENYEDRVLAVRLGVAKSFYVALEELNRRSPLSALDILKSAEQVLADYSSRTGDPQVGKHKAALETEKDLVRIARNVAEISFAFFESGKDPLSPAPVLKKALAYTVENARKASKPVKDVVSVSETWVSSVFSRMGRKTMRVVGEGEVYLPFYAVSTSITFTSGLILKKGLETRADILVSAAPPVVNALTDVFGVYTGKPVNLEKEQEKLHLVSKLLNNSRLEYLRRPAVLPLISPSTAELVADEYLEAARSKYGGRVKLAATQARELVYVGAVLEGSQLKTQIPIHVFTVKPGELMEIAV